MCVCVDLCHHGSVTTQSHRATAMTVVAIVLWSFAIRLSSKGCVKTESLGLGVHVCVYVCWVMQGGALLLQQ